MNNSIGKISNTKHSKQKKIKENILNSNLMNWWMTRYKMIDDSDGWEEGKKNSEAVLKSIQVLFRTHHNFIYKLWKRTRIAAHFCLLLLRTNNDFNKCRQYEYKLWTQEMRSNSLMWLEREKKTQPPNSAHWEQYARNVKDPVSVIFK